MLDWIKSLSESEASFWGSIIGSTIGVIGAFLVGLFAESAKKSTHIMHERSLEVMAIIHLHAERTERRSFKDLKELADFTVTRLAVNNKVRKLLKVYSEQSTLRDV